MGFFEEVLGFYVARGCLLLLTTRWGLTLTLKRYSHF